MPVPSLNKTWQYTYGGGTSSLNRLRATSGVLLTDMREAMFLIKTILIGFASNPWTVVSSSDSSTAGAGDKWLTSSNLVWNTAGVAHSWIVLQQDGIQTGFQLCIDLTPSGGSQANFFASMAGFTGGSTTARPTATDENQLGPTNTTWLRTDAGTVWLNVVQSSDGQCTRVFAFNAAVGSTLAAPGAFWLLDRPQDPVTGWTNPYVGMVRGQAAGTALTTYNNLVNTAPSTNLLRGRHSTFNFDANFTTELYGTSTIYLGDRLQLPNDISGEYAIVPCGFASETASAVGRHGNLFDLWMGPANVHSGDTFPLSATRQFVKFGDLLLPWNSAEGLVRWG